MSPPCWISIEISAVGLRTDGDSRCFTAHGSRGFVKVARPDRFLSFRLPYTDPVGSAHRQHERWTGQGTTVHRGSGSPRAKHKEMTRQRAPQEQDVRSVAPRFFSGVCCSFLSLSLYLSNFSPCSAWWCRDCRLVDGASASGWSLVLAICRNRRADSLLHHRAPESKVRSEVSQADSGRRKPPGRPQVVFSWILACSLVRVETGGMGWAAAFWLACSFYTLHCVLRVGSN